MSELRTALADALGPLYRIEREVRPVGDTGSSSQPSPKTAHSYWSKFLPAALSLGINDLQFERAVLLVGERLRHPNLVRPRGAGRAGSFVYHTRPFVPGTTLRAWIGNNGAIPLARTVEILRGMLSGWRTRTAARLLIELKAENVLLADEGVLVADTGIAGALGKAATRAQRHGGRAVARARDAHRHEADESGKSRSSARAHCRCGSPNGCARVGRMRAGRWRPCGRRHPPARNPRSSSPDR